MTSKTVEFGGDRYVVESLGHYLTTRVYRIERHGARRISGILEALVIDRLDGRSNV